MLHVEGFDHLVLRCTDVEASLRWYQELLGLEAERVEQWRAGDVPFPSVRIDGATIIDLLTGAPDGTNVDHLCLVVDAATDLDALAADDRFQVLRGPVEVWGALGVGRSVYVLDPAGHQIELRAYPS